MKKILFDNCFVNRLIDKDSGTNENYAFLRQLKDEKKIKIYCNPTNIVEIALCTDMKKRKSLATVLNQLVKGKNILLNWDAYQVLFLFRELEKEIPGIIINEGRLLEFSYSYCNLLIGLLGQMSIFEEYKVGSFEYIIKQKLITKYYQARFVSDPDYYLRTYKEQLNGTLKPEDIEDDSKFDSMTLSELEKIVKETEQKRKKIKNIKDFSKHKKDMIHFFSRFEMKNSFYHFFIYKEHIEKSLSLRKLSEAWGKDIFGQSAKPLRSELCKVFSDPQSSPTIVAYQEILSKLIDRLPVGSTFPLDKMFGLYLNEIEKILNRTKSLSKGSSMDLDYFPSMMMVDHFITDDKELYDNCRKALTQMGKSSDKILSYSVSWKKEITA